MIRDEKIHCWPKKRAWLCVLHILDNASFKNPKKNIYNLLKLLEFPVFLFDTHHLETVVSWSDFSFIWSASLFQSTSRKHGRFPLIFDHSFWLESQTNHSQRNHHFPLNASFCAKIEGLFQDFVRRCESHCGRIFQIPKFDYHQNHRGTRSQKRHNDFGNT